jgi:2'-5' RNA ligase
VTLRFLGEVEAPEPVAEALAAAGLGRAEAALGPAAARLGAGVLCVPVAGLDDLARAVTDATAAFGRPPEDRPFRGHVTLARARGRGRLPGSLGRAVGAFKGRFPVTDVRLVRSRPGSDGPQYEDLAVVPLA